MRVSRPFRRPSDVLIVPAPRVGKQVDAFAEEVLEQFAARPQVLFAVPFRECGQIMVGVAMGGEVHTLVTELEDLVQAEGPERVGGRVVDPVHGPPRGRERLRHQEHRRGQPVAGEDGEGAVVEVGEAVVERQRGQAVGQDAPAVQMGDGVGQCQHPPPARQPPAVPLERRGGDRQWGVPLRLDGVVAEDGHGSQPSSR